jgi:serine/threonine protein kinase/CBS domain-containing protein
MGFFDFLSKKSSNNSESVLKVRDIMTRNPIVVSGTATIAQIEEIFSKISFWSIYVGDPDKYIGIITRDDIKFRGRNKSKTSPAYSIMSKGVFSIDENADVEEAKTLIYNKKINGLAVTRNGKHCGIITLYDIKNKQLKSYDSSQEEVARIDTSSPPTSPPRNDGQTWTYDDIQLLRQSWGEGKSIEILAKQLERSSDAVVHKLIDTGLIGYNDDNCDPKPARFGLTWSENERKQLISEFNAGKSIPEIAKIHQRNKNTILHNLIKLEIINYIDRRVLEKYIDDNIPHDTNQLIRALISELENNSNDVRNSAATQLGSFHEPSVVNALIKCVKNDPKIRYRALAALRNIGDPLGIPTFIERLKDRSVRIRLVSVNALGELGDSNVVKHLESHIKSKDYQNALKNGGNPEIIQAAGEAIQKIRSRESLGESDLIEKPKLTVSLDRTQLSAGRSHKLGVILTNTGASDVKNVLLAFSSEFETKGIKPISVTAGQSSCTDINITPKTVGTVLLDVTLTYKDTKGRNYQSIQEFWIDVVEKGTPAPPPFEIPQSPVNYLSPQPLTLTQLPQGLSERYTQSEFIGKGGFARVFKAKRKDGKYVAVKIPISLDESTGRSFIAEMQSWTRLSHPNIVKLYDFNIMPVPYFEMELCDTSLDKIPKPQDPAKAGWILFLICDGLKYTHSNKIIHRDLKPHNILLKNGIPKISDWGLAKVIADSTITSASAFTFPYAAPEQVRNQSKDERTDIWQIGVILYEITTGKLPFASDDIIEIIRQIVSEDPKKPSAINPECKDLDPVILKCLEKDPAKRYQSVFELQKDLAAFLQVDFSQSLTKSMREEDFVRSACLCCELLQMSMKIGDIISARKYASTLVHYTDGEIKKSIKELENQLQTRIDNGIYEIPPELIENADFIALNVRLGSGNKE